ncbi:cation:proton antiporter [Alloiococcus sp. CFN-8]|uniref:cation:proton antiporter n=1 Tax=Alloiococcus sp. CFN-8 TaxID=3416081 RepID=UPI003CE85789
MMMLGGIIFFGLKERRERMNIYFINLSIAIIVGLMMSRLAKKLNLPAVTAYLMAGLLLGPFCIGALGIEGLGFNTLSQVEHVSFISQGAMGFIAFAIGNEFRLSQLKTMGRKAITIGILQAVATTAVVDIALIGLHFLMPDLISIPAAITLGAIASATAPAATLMVVRQYKADGPLTKLLMLVVAIDDAVGLVLFAVSFGIANAIEAGSISVSGMVVEPILEIVLSLALGALIGTMLHLLERFFHSRSKRMSLSVAVVLLAVGLSNLQFELAGVHCGFSLLLVCMMTGTVFCNTCETSEELMSRVDGWTGPLIILFFILSGAELDLKILSNPMIVLVGVVYILFRSLGKYYGSYGSCLLTKCNEKITKNLGITLLPQAGVALGMSLTASALSDGAIIRNVILFSVLIYELIGPALTKRSLMLSGEIKPVGKTNARSVNKQKNQLALD